MYTAVIEKCEDDYFIPFPREVIEMLNLKEGDNLEVTVKDETIMTN